MLSPLNGFSGVNYIVLTIPRLTGIKCGENCSTTDLPAATLNCSSISDKCRCLGMA